MLKAILTNHISQNDLGLLSLQVNDSLMGKLDHDETSNRVISGNREVHLVASFDSSVDDRQERRYIQEQARLFGLLFSDLQTLGIAALPDLVDKYRPAAASLMIASAELVLIWRDRQKGVYLLRDKKLYRLQPSHRPQDLWADDWMTYGDFYAYVPQENDLLLYLSPDFVDRFKAEQLEEVFSSNMQIFSMMSKLKELGKTYGYNLDHSWFAMQFQRLEVNRIYKGHVEENLSEEVRRIARAQNFSKAISRSKVSRVIKGQDLVEPKGPRPKLMRPISPSPDFIHTDPKPQLGDWRQSQQVDARINLIDEDVRREKARNQEAYAPKAKALDQYFERAREFQIEPLKDKFQSKIKNFFNLWPDQPFFSKLFASSLSLLVILLLALGLKTMANRQPKSLQNPEEVTSETTVEQIKDNAIAIPPAQTNLEKAIVVRVNNLQMRQAKDSSSALLASIKRGETLTQLAPEEEGWIYVRNSEGVEGYVFADYLMPEE